jgi:hypothetical protein
MRRVVSLYLPTWPTDRLRRRLGKDAPPADIPVVLIGRSGRKRLVLAADAAAQALRLYPGMAATQARALCAELVVHDAEPGEDAEALSAELASVGGRDAPFPLPHGRSDEFHRGPPGPYPREGPARGPMAGAAYLPDQRVASIRQKTRDFH